MTTSEHNPSHPLPTIAFLHEELVCGGAEKVSISTARHLKTKGIHSVFFITKQSDLTDYQLEDLDVYLLPNEAQHGEYFTPDNIDKLATIIETRNIRALLIIGSNMTILRVPQRLRQLTPKCKYVYWLHNKPFWEFDDKQGNARVNALCSRKKKLIYELIKRPKYILLKSHYIKKLQQKYKECLSTLDGLITLHPVYQQQLITDLQLSEAEGKNIFSFINTLDVCQQPNLEKKKKIAYVGRLALSSKQVDLFLRMWKRIASKLPLWELCIYGTGPAEEMLKKLIHQHHIPQVQLMGYVANTQEIYNDIAILCLLSKYEGWPLVLTEAQNNGVIPIAFDCCRAIQSIIGKGEEAAGVLVAADDWKKLGKEIIGLCKDEAYRNNLQQRCLEKRWNYQNDLNEKEWHNFLAWISEEKDTRKQ